MKGVILAGGSGTRLFPNTKVTNKHLLPVYNQPMIYYPIQTLLKAGITDILILPGKDHAGDFARLLGSGKEFNANFTIKVQDHAGGLAYAVGLAEDFVGDDDFVVLFGDNILEDNIIQDVQNFNGGAKVFLKQVADPQRFGVAELKGDKVLNIEEKPSEPKSDWAAIGVYIYDSKAFDYIKRLEPSERGELEITDLNNIYVNNGEMKAGFVEGFWFDVGTHESLVEAAHRLKTMERPVEPLRMEQRNAPKVVAGGILYDSSDGKYSTSPYLPYFLEALKQQDYNNLELVFVDNSDEEDNANVRYIKQHYPEAEIIRPGENTGFARANNIMIRRTREKQGDYFLALNIDILPAPNTVSELVNTMIKSPQVGSATCKVKRWRFEEANKEDKGKTNFIDTTGILMTRGHRFFDRGQGELDHGQFDKTEEVFGSSGAVAMYNVNALEDIAFVNENQEKEYFDELMFMYKEDVDISYRLQLAGYKCMYTPNTTVYHDRSIAAEGRGLLSTIKGRMSKGRANKEWSWLNHHIILRKILDNNYSGNVRLKTFMYELKSNAYILLFEPYLIKQWWKLFKLRKQIRARRKQLKKRIRVRSNIEKFMLDE